MGDPRDTKLTDDLTGGRTSTRLSTLKFARHERSPRTLATNPRNERSPRIIANELEHSPRTLATNASPDRGIQITIAKIKSKKTFFLRRAHLCCPSVYQFV